MLLILHERPAGTTDGRRRGRKGRRTAIILETGNVNGRRSRGNIGLSPHLPLYPLWQSRIRYLLHPCKVSPEYRTPVKQLKPLNENENDVDARCSLRTATGLL